MLTPTEMEHILGNIDHRLTSVEQMLPTLATKQDLERFATNDDLRQGLAEAKAHTLALHEDLRDQIGMVAEGVATLSVRFDLLSTRVARLETATTRLDIKVGALDTRLGHVETTTERVEQKLDLLVDRLEHRGVI